MANDAIFGNLRSYEIYGINPAEPASFDSWNQRVHPGDRPLLTARMKALLSHGAGDRWDEEFRILHATKGERWIHDIGQVEHDETGRAVQVAGITLDITDKKRVEEGLLLFRSLLDEAMDTIEVIDPESGRLLDANRQAWDSLGYTRSELLSLTLPEIDPLVTKPVFHQQVKRLRDNGVTVMIESLRRQKNGVTFPVEISVQLIRADREYLVTVARDITGRKRAEAALRNSEEQLRSLTDSVPVFIAQVGTDLRYRFVNDRYARLFGRAAEEFVGRHLREVMGEETFAQAAPHMMEALSGACVAYDLDLRDAAERALTVHVSYVPDFDGAGAVTGFIAAITDITARKQAETALKESHTRLRDVTRQLAGAEERERLRIARELHDEFGQALTGLNFNLAALIRRISRLDNSAERRALHEKAEPMSLAIDRLIQSVRSTATALRPRVLDDLGLAAGFEWLADWFHDHTGRGCTVTIDPATDIEALGFDLSSTVFRAAQELVTNVARHADASTAVIRLSVQDGQVRLTVQDDGRGLHEEALRNPRSLGLRGLRERVELLRGTVIVAGSPSKGTTVSLTIPVESGVACVQKEPT